MADNAFERLPRLLAIVPWLSARPGVTFTDAAEHFGITVDQLTTDLYQLVVCGIPGYGPDQLVDIDFYDLERIWVTDPQTLQKPMRLTAEEVSAMTIALRLLAQIPGFEYRTEIDDLLAKMETVNIDSLDVSSDSLIVVTPQVEIHTQELVHDSLTAKTKLGFRYLSGSQAVTDRVTSPIRVFSVNDHQYLDAFCDSAEARRLFRLDRISDAYSISEPSILPPEEDLTDNLEAISQAPRAILRLTDRTAWLVDEPEVELVDSTPLLISIPYLSDDWLARWILGIGGGVSVVSPPSLAFRVKELAQTAHESLVKRV
jgi:proteasome accessory factor C